LGLLEDVKTKLEIRYLSNGTFVQEIPLDVGTVQFANGKKHHDEFFFKFVSFLTPGNIFRVNMSDDSKPYEAVVRKTFFFLNTLLYLH